MIKLCIFKKIIAVITLEVGALKWVGDLLCGVSEISLQGALRSFRLKGHCVNSRALLELSRYNFQIFSSILELV